MPYVRASGGDRKKKKSAVGHKIAEMMGEGYKPKVAQAAALNMERRGKLGPQGQYHRVHKTKRGPLGRMRKGT